MLRLLIFALSIVSMVGVTACGEGEFYKPRSVRDERWMGRGKLTGEDGLSLMGGKADEAVGSGAIAVNSFLWRATLDTLSFMPLSSADPFGGVIITDWYENPETPGERYKVNALILDRSLRADGVKVTLFKQKISGGTWHDIAVDHSMERSLEDTILTRARQLKVTQLGK